jgi:hypothetical protein
MGPTELGGWVVGGPVCWVRQRELGRRETRSVGPVPVCEIAGREMVLAGNGGPVPVCERAVREMVLAENGGLVPVCESWERNGFRPEMVVQCRSVRELVCWSGAGLWES